MENNPKLLENLKKLILENSVNKIVIGESKNYKMEDNEIMTEILDLKKVLEVELDMDVDLNPEFLSSMEARNVSGKSEMIDSSSAAIILQDYLNKKNR